jgi:single-strand DNA-binding protein
MADLNSVALTGRLTADPEFKEFGEGKQVANFSLAVNEYKKEGGDAVSFVPVTVWNKTAEVAKNWLKKGSQVAIKGRLQQQRWEQDGQKRSKIQIICESLTLLGGKKKENAEPAASVSGGDSPF